ENRREISAREIIVAAQDRGGGASAQKPVAGIMNIYLLRHGIAVDPSAPGFPKDADRPLTPKGRRRLRQIAGAMGALKISFDVILSSPYVRAQQTAELVTKILKRRKKLKFTDELTPGG